MKMMFNELSSMRKVVLYRNEYNEKNKAPLIAFNIKGYHSEEVAGFLNENSVAVRGGYHCSPLAHISMGTKDTGTVRISPSFRTSKKDINILLNLVRKIAIKEII
jgi:selenocysteine lyase/cysteine desulfurase